MKVLNFWNVKGGVGKSSLCFLTGEILRSSGKKILFIDADPQRSITKTILEHPPGHNTFFDVLMRSKEISECMYQEKGFSIVPAHIDLLKIQSGIEENRLLSAFANYKGNFDYVLIDNQPTWNSIVRTTINACDRLIIPSMISIFDLDEVNFSINEARMMRKNLPVSIILNAVNSSEKISNDEREYIDSFLDTFKNDVARAKIPRSVILKRIIDRGDNLCGKGATKEKFRSALLNMVQEITLSKISLKEVA
ncbi:MAG: ParA family protein [Leptospira sp.]|nr:ParA family protein [Leptospira sp.]